MKLVLIGNIFDKFLIDYSNTVIDETISKITIVYGSNNKDINSIKIKYPSNFNFINYQDFSSKTWLENILIKVPKVRSFIFLTNAKKIIKKNLYDIDYFHVFFVDHKYSSYYKFLMDFRLKGIFTFYGSDLLRVNKTKLKKLHNVIYNASSITLATNRMKETFICKFPNFEVSKILKYNFGSFVIDYIEQVRKEYSINQLKKEYSIPENKIVITIGYNSNKEQQHLKILKSIFKNKKNKPQEMFVIIPFQYGELNIRYQNRIKKYLNYKLVDYRFLFEYSYGIELAKERFISDIFIHAQTTDAFSASLLEYAFADNLVLNSTWNFNIEYEQIKNIVHFQSFKELSNVNILEKFKSHRFNDGSKIIVKEYLKWDIQKDKWIGLYKN